MAERLRNCLQSNTTPVRIRTLASISIQFNSSDCGGHSGGETPDPFPNSEDKPARVRHCTQVREPSGNVDRCRDPYYYFLLKKSFLLMPYLIFYFDYILILILSYFVKNVILPASHPLQYLKLWRSKYRNLKFSDIIQCHPWASCRNCCFYPQIEQLIRFNIVDID